MLWTAAIATDWSSFAGDAGWVAPDLVPVMLAATRTAALDHREALAVLASSTLFLAVALALAAVAV